MRKILATLQSFASWLQVLRVGPRRPAWLPALLPQNRLSLAQTQSLRHTRQISQEFDTDTIQPSHSRHLSVPNTSHFHFPTCWGLFGGIDGSTGSWLVIWASGCHLLTVSLSVCLASSSVLRKKKKNRSALARPWLVHCKRICKQVRRKKNKRLILINWEYKKIQMAK